jgi:hypothetical protein
VERAAFRPATQSGDTLTYFGAHGYTGSAWVGTKATTFMYASENFSGTNQGTHIAFETTAIGGTTRSEKMRIHGSGGVSIGSTADPGAGVINANSGYTVGAKPMGQVLLNTLTASGSATLDDTINITSAYDLYFIEYENVAPATNAVNLMLQFTKNAGGAWLATGYLNQLGGATDSVWVNSGALVDNTAGTGASGIFYVMGPNRTDNKKLIHGVGTQVTAGAAVGVTTRGWYNTDSDAFNGMRFKMTSGNISTGKIRIYGIRTS